MRKIALLLIGLFCVCATAQTYNPGSVKKYGFWDTQYQEPIIILNDSRAYFKHRSYFLSIDQTQYAKFLIPLSVIILYFKSMIYNFLHW